MIRGIRRFLEGEDAPFLMKNPHHLEGDADFKRIKSFVESFGLLQCCAHGCRLTTCSQVNQVNTSGNSVEVQYVVVLTSSECAEVIVDDLLPYEVVNNNRGSSSLISVLNCKFVCSANGFGNTRVTSFNVCSSMPTFTLVTDIPAATESKS